MKVELQAAFDALYANGRTELANMTRAESLVAGLSDTELADAARAARLLATVCTEANLSESARDFGD